jgi:hypothetical protein
VDGAQVKQARLAFILLLATAAPWGANLFGGSTTQLIDTAASGPLDYVKLAVVIVAAIMAWRARPRTGMPLPGWLLLGYAAAAAVGAWLGSDSTSGVERAARFALVVLAVIWAVGRIGLTTALRCVTGVAVVMALAALGAVATGLQPLVSGSRLGGYLPALAPNVLAEVLVTGILAAFGLWMERQLAVRWVLVAELLLGFCLVLTGSRTSLGALVAALAVALLRSLFTARPLRAFLGLAFAGIAVGVSLLVQWNTSLDLWGSLATRGGSAGLDPTLSGRTLAWQVAIASNQTTTQHLFGQGLQVKQVYIPRGLTEYVAQGIDSSWLSAYVAAGWVGAVLLGAAVLVALLATLRSGRIGALAIVAAMAVSSFTESSLADISFGLVLFVTAAVAGRRDAAEPAVETADAPAVTA